MSEERTEREQHEAMIGQVIARKFQLVRLLGAGGMGAVFEAEDTLLKRRVALKLMKPDVARSRAMAERFIREGRAANAIEHRNIVRVFDLAMDEESGSLFIVQELLCGESLAARLEREQRLTVAEAVVVLDSVLDALQCAHDKGIVHRDIKPDNVFLHRGEDGSIVPKIIDFGISKVTSAQQEGLSKTQTGTALGTPYYMSPEQIRGDSDIDHRADLWSAGVMAFEMMTGRRPFNGDNYNMLIINIITSPPPDASAVEPSVPHSVSEVIKRSLMMDREQRYSDARSLREALDEAVLESGARVTNVIPLAPASMKPAAKTEHAGTPMIEADSLASMTVDPPPPTLARKRFSWIAIGASVALVAVVAAVGVRTSRERARPAALPAAVIAPSQTSVASTTATSPQPAPRDEPAARPTTTATNATTATTVTAATSAATQGSASVSRGGRGRDRVAMTAPVAGTTTSATRVAETTRGPDAPREVPREAPVERPAPRTAEAPVIAPAQPDRSDPAGANGAASSSHGENPGPTQPRRLRFSTSYPQ